LGQSLYCGPDVVWIPEFCSRFLAFQLAKYSLHTVHFERHETCRHLYNRSKNGTISRILLPLTNQTWHQTLREHETNAHSDLFDFSHV
jgi:hypothetical protein